MCGRVCDRFFTGWLRSRVASSLCAWLVRYILSIVSAVPVCSKGGELDLRDTLGEMRVTRFCLIRLARCC